MLKKIYLSLLIFWAIFVKGIVGTLTEDDLRDSTNSLIRHKRVLNRQPGQDVPFPSAVSSYTINIKLLNTKHCVGTVLSMKTAVTAARCVVHSNLSAYKVLAGSSYSINGSVHYIREARMHGNHPVQGQSFETGIALIYVIPPFQPIRGNIQTIGLHAEPLLPSTIGMVRGWGSYYYRGTCQTKYFGRLRAIEVPIISHRDCVNQFRGFFNITDAYFCTHDSNKQCGFTDTGAGFITENSLAGVYIGAIETGRDTHLKPDVFIMLQHFDYHQWILRNIEH